ncbi:MAG: GvpL/GvpF family gas vesicle protein [Candidatus Tectomicrobia bacterium]|nr:GvpL/GvpF family gas vesicle protein [Candidatus Tectomicrobia bacterium]
MGEGKFLYAIIEREGEESLPFRGLGDAPLETVFYRDLAAVVSSLDLGRFEGQDKEHLKADLVKYQQVNLFLLAHSTMVPLRFGTTARDRDQVEEVLGRLYLQLKRFLNRLRGKVELVVQAFWDLPKILREIGNGEASSLNQEIFQRRGQTDPREVLEIGRKLFEMAEARKKVIAETIHSRLSPLARDSSEGPQQGEAMILNRSYLVDRGKEPLFDEAMNRLGNEYEGDLTFRYIGPLPSYSFVNIELTRGNFALVDQARKTLGLSEKTSWNRIKAAYRNLVSIYHPDRNRNDPQAEERCKEVMEAYEILEAYCQSYEGEITGDYFFAREEVEQTFILKERLSR